MKNTTSITDFIKQMEEKEGLVITDEDRQKARELLENGHTYNLTFGVSIKEFLCSDAMNGAFGMSTEEHAGFHEAVMKSDFSDSGLVGFVYYIDEDGDNNQAFLLEGEMLEVTGDNIPLSSVKPIEVIIFKGE